MIFRTLISSHARLALLLIAAFLVLSPVGALRAHPHSWIDVRSTVVTDGPTIRAVRHEWSFDEAYTKALLAEVGSSPADLKSFAATALRNLAAHAYFTRLKIDGRDSIFDSPVDASADVVAQRLTLVFTLPLRDPARVRGAHLALSVYDPTFYIEMLYGTTQSVVVQGIGYDACDASLRPADPPQGARERALQLDREAVPDYALGEQFAEVIDIRCR